MSSRLNEPRIDFTQKEIETAYQEILKNMGENKLQENIKSKNISGIKYT